jgi:hypothetical protein
MLCHMSYLSLEFVLVHLLRVDEMASPAHHFELLQQTSTVAILCCAGVAAASTSSTVVTT